MSGRQADGLLRCGACWRDVFGTPEGVRWHEVFPDGSMRCWAPDTMHNVDAFMEWVSTRIVHATEERLRLLATALDQQQQMRDDAESKADAMRLSHE